MSMRFSTRDREQIAGALETELSTDASLSTKIGNINDIVERRVGPVKFTFLHHETRSGRLLGSHFFNFDRQFVDAYADYYSRLNPWVSYWAGQPDGTIAASQQVRPSSSFRRSEFFADYLRPQKDVTAAAGMKLCTAGGSIVHFAWHYSEPHAAAFDGLFTDVLNLAGETIRRSISLSRDIGSDEAEVEGLMAAPASGVAALAVTSDSVVLERNLQADRILDEARICRLADGRLRFVDPSAQHRFRRLMNEMRLASRAFGACVLTNGPHPVSARIYRQSATHTRGRVLTARPARWLVVIATWPQAPDMQRFKAIEEGFDLTRREYELCCAIASGIDLAAISVMTGLSIGTLRGRLKEIFRKTRTGRQTELVALMYQLL